MADLNKLKLWVHQKDAIEKASIYLNAPPNGKSFLLKLPTGSGKTGIMATIARFSFPSKNILIVVPSIALRKQLFDHISNKFWDTIGFDKSELASKEIHELLPSTLGTIKDDIKDKPFILLCVVNTLHIIRKENPVNYTFLKDKVDFIIFDEGHREPAYSWANAVRSLEKQILLFTATPFRNDLRLFNVDKENYYPLFHVDAVNSKVIRDIEVNLNPVTLTDLDKSLKETILKIERDKKKFLESEKIEPKVLIRCKNEETIRRVVEIIKKEGKRVLGVHENFNNKSNLFDEVPDSAIIDKHEYVVHQNKLIEGIDYPEFLILVVVDSFGNERSLIQQIGRITRNPKQNDVKKSIIYSTHPLEIKNTWDKYLNYDNNINEYGKLYDPSDIYQSNPNIRWTYFNKSFKNISRLEQLDPSKIIIPKRAIIRENFSKINHETSIDLIEEDLAKYDILIFNTFRLPNTGYLIFHETYTNSPFLKDEAYIENKLGVIIFYLIDDYIYYYSSDGITPECLINRFHSINQEKLVNTLKHKQRLTRINLINSDIGTYNIRSRNISSFSLENAPPSLSDHNYVATLTEAVVNNSIGQQSRRYVGISRSKVSDYGSDYIEIPDYYKWLRDINSLLNSTASYSLKYLKRFAQQIIPPADPTPIHILLDIDQDDISSFLVNGKEKFEFLDISSEIVKGKFDISVIHRGVTKIYTCTIDFDSASKKYKIYSSALGSLIYNPTSSENIIGFINKNQLFRIITNNCASFFSFGSFYSPKLNLNKRKDDLDILSLFVQIKDLQSIESEKGDNVKLLPLATTWHKHTLFGLIARSGKGYLDEKLLNNYLNFEYLVCDDLNKENADFIGINKTKGIITLIHAKGKKAILSASSFQEVCGQAVKNLDLFSPFYEKKPETNFKKWNNPWNNSKIGKVNNRMLKGGLTGEKFWELFEEMVRNPSTKKSVYIITGNMFSKAELEKELNKKNIRDLKPEVIQLVYLIRTTWSSVSSVGADLKIFCY